MFCKIIIYICHMNLTGEIMLLRWGLVPNLPSFNVSVGQTLGGKERIKVVQIVREDFPETNKSAFHIEGEQGEGRLAKRFVWKTYNLMPDEIQYFAPDEKHDYVKV